MDNLPESKGFKYQNTGSWTKLVHDYLRWALLAGMSGPSGVDTMHILGRSETLRRLDVAEKALRTGDGGTGGDEVDSTKLQD